MTREAHVWLPYGRATFTVLDFPQAFAIGPWIYHADLARDGGLLIRTANGTERVDYRSRRAATPADQPDIEAAPWVDDAR